MLNRILSYINSLFVTEPTSKTWSWTMKTCHTCHRPVPACDGSLQRFPDSQQIVGDYCTNILKQEIYGDMKYITYGCKATLLSPYHHNHKTLLP